MSAIDLLKNDIMVDNVAEFVNGYLYKYDGYMECAIVKDRGQWVDVQDVLHVYVVKGTVDLTAFNRYDTLDEIVSLIINGG